jgi:hypothetical protein
MVMSHERSGRKENQNDENLNADAADERGLPRVQSVGVARRDDRKMEHPRDATGSAGVHQMTKLVRGG